jgi:hypothetical protein
MSTRTVVPFAHLDDMPTEQLVNVIDDAAHTLARGERRWGIGSPFDDAESRELIAWSIRLHWRALSALVRRVPA